MKIFKIAALSLGLSMLNTACSDDFIERQFYQSVVADDLNTETEVESFVRGIYTSMRSSSYLGRDYLLYGELRSDYMGSRERQIDTSVFRYTMTSTNSSARSTYSAIYSAMAKANIVINTDTDVISGTDEDRKKVNFHKGQALVLRGWLAFDLLKLYGQKYTGGTLGIVYPLVYDPEAKQARGTIEENETQIEKDFEEGLALMEANISYNPTTKTELSVNAAKAIMSRYYLYKENYSKVSSLVADIYGQYSVVAKDAFVSSWALDDSAPNSIFELAVGAGGNLGTSSLYNIYHTDGYYDLRLISSSLLNTYFPSTDIRSELFSGRYLIGKFTSQQSNVKLIRYEEVLLNGAEAERALGNSTLALTYVNEIRTNRGLAERTSLSSSNLRTERLQELIGEGFRYWDLLRWGRKTSIYYFSRYGNSNDNLLAFPIPIKETQLEGSLVVSNPGYDN